MRRAGKRQWGENDGIDHVAEIHYFSGLVDALRPGHFREMDEAFDAGLEFDEGTEISDAGDDTAHAIAERELVGRLRRPRDWAPATA